MVEQSRSWRLHGDGRLAFAAVAAEFTCFAASTSGTVRRHAAPAWQLTLSWDGPVVATDDRGRVAAGPGLLIPPGLPTTFTRPDGGTRLWIDPHCLTLPAGRRVHELDRAQVRTLLAAVDGGFELHALRRAVNGLFGPPATVDPRLRQAVGLLCTGTELAAVAARVGVSPRRLRQLSAEAVGCPLAGLRRWHRTREAMLHSGAAGLATAAAEAGFADQAHMTRTITALIGRTPGAALAEALKRSAES